MPEVVGVRFKPCGKIYSFEVDGVCARPGMRVVVESDMGLSLGTVVRSRHTIDNPGQQMKKILRLATVPDIEADRNNRDLEREAMAYCVESAKRHSLYMKVVRTEATLDRKRLIFYFTAEGRIDFRELVRDLASKFKTRIEMRQIGVRDEVKNIGGIGCCGREVCCRIFLASFEPISIKMAKKQELALNPGKLSGICGRLMCCLGYEIEQRGKEREKETAVISASAEETVEIAESAETGSDMIPAAAFPVAAPPATEGKVPEQPKPQVPQMERPREKEQAKERTPQKPERGRPFNRRRKFWKKKKRNNG